MIEIPSNFVVGQQQQQQRVASPEEEAEEEPEEELGEEEEEEEAAAAAAAAPRETRLRQALTPFLYRRLSQVRDLIGDALLKLELEPSADAKERDEANEVDAAAAAAAAAATGDAVPPADSDADDVRPHRFPPSFHNFFYISTTERVELVFALVEVGFDRCAAVFADDFSVVPWHILMPSAFLVGENCRPKTTASLPAAAAASGGFRLGRNRL